MTTELVEINVERDEVASEHAADAIGAAASPPPPSSGRTCHICGVPDPPHLCMYRSREACSTH
eukprot:5505265-Prorocentrum_lima.AAC.1